MLTISKLLFVELLSLIAESFPSMPPEHAKRFITRSLMKGYSFDETKKLIDKATDKFIPAYGVNYPSAGYIFQDEHVNFSLMTDQEFWKYYWPYRDVLFCTSLNGLRPDRKDAERDLKFYLSKKAVSNGRY